MGVDVFAQAIATLFASYLGCAICFPEPFATFNIRVWTSYCILNLYVG
jgi:hypothetical protein